MKQCTLYLNIAGNKTPITFQVSEKAINETDSEINLLAEIMKHAIDEGKEGSDNIISEITSALLDTSFVEYKKRENNEGIRYMPNYSEASVKEAFPEYTWGEGFGNICLVNEIPKNVLESDKGNYFGFRALKSIDGKDSFIYVIPRDQLKNFAKYTVAKTAAEKLKLYKVVDDENFQRPLTDKEQLDLGMLLSPDGKTKTSIDLSVLNLNLLTAIEEKLDSDPDPNPELAVYYNQFKKDFDILEDFKELSKTIIEVKPTTKQKTVSKENKFYLSLLTKQYNIAKKNIPIPSLFANKTKSLNGIVDKVCALLDGSEGVAYNFLQSLKKGYQKYHGFTLSDDVSGESVDDLSAYFEISLSTKKSKFDELYDAIMGLLESRLNKLPKDHEAIKSFNLIMQLIKELRESVSKLKNDLTQKTFVLNEMSEYLSDGKNKRTKTIQEDNKKNLTDFFDLISTDKYYQLLFPGINKNNYLDVILKTQEDVLEYKDSFDSEINENQEEEDENFEEVKKDILGLPMDQLIDRFLNPTKKMLSLERKNADINVLSNDIIHKLAGYHSKRNSKSNFINYCEYLLSKHNDGRLPKSGFLLYSEIERYMVLKGLLPKRKKGSTIPYNEIFNYVKENLTGYDERFYIDFNKSKSDRIPIGVTSRTTFGALSGEVSKLTSETSMSDRVNRLSTVYNIKPLEDPSTGKPKVTLGYYMYYYNGKYFISRNLWSYYDKNKLYDTEREALNAIYDSFRNQTLYSGLFLNRGLYRNAETSDPIMSPRGKYYKQGQLVQMLDYEFNESSYNVNQDLTVGEYLDNLQRAYPGINFLKLLGSTEKLAMLYSKIDNKFNEDSSEIYSIANDISNALTKTMMAINDTVPSGKHNYLSDTRSYFTRFREVKDSELNFTESSEGGSEHRNIYSIVDWNAILEIFNRNGIPMVILTEQLVNELKAKHPGKRINAFTENGIIYINPFAASFTTPLHEYTHVLLGVLKSINGGQAYEDLFKSYLRSFKEEQWNNAMTKYKEKGYEDSEIPEEMFADDFAKYLSEHNVTYSQIFGIATSLIEDSEFWNTTPDFLGKANSKFDIFKGMLSEFRLIRDNIGMGLYKTTAGTTGAKYKKILEKIVSMSKSDFDNLSYSSSDGIYKYCN